MGNNNSVVYESNSDNDDNSVNELSFEQDVSRSQSITPQVEQRDLGASEDDDDLMQYEEGPATLGTHVNAEVDEEDQNQVEDEVIPPKTKSKRIKKVEDYFQWDSLSLKQKDMYYDFVKTAKKTWTELGHEDDIVEKAVLNKIALLRF